MRVLGAPRSFDGLRLGCGPTTRSVGESDEKPPPPPGRDPYCRLSYQGRRAPLAMDRCPVGAGLSPVLCTITVVAGHSLKAVSGFCETNPATGAGFAKRTLRAGRRGGFCETNPATGRAGFAKRTLRAGRGGGFCETNPTSGAVSAILKRTPVRHSERGDAPTSSSRLVATIGRIGKDLCNFFDGCADGCK